MTYQCTISLDQSEYVEPSTHVGDYGVYITVSYVDGQLFDYAIN